MKNLYSVYDTVNEEFAQPFMLNNDNSAIDMFLKDVRNIAKQNLAKFQDPDISRYQLFFLCYFDNEIGFVSGPVDSSLNWRENIALFNRCIYDVSKDFDFSEFDDQIKEIEETKGLEVK